MWSSKMLKQNAKLALKQNYWRAVGICLLTAFLVGGIAIGTVHFGVFSPSEIGDAVLMQSADRFAVKSNSQIVDEFLHEGEPQSFLGEPKPTRGVLAAVFNNATKSQSILFGVLNAVNQFVFNDQIFGGVIVLIGALLGILYWLFISNIVQVGRNRFFMENRLYKGTKTGRILFSYQVRRGRRTAWVMFVRSIWLYLWSLTVVGGIIKRYSYYMIPYIMAENPDINRKEAFALSRSMMNGQKWRTFVLELSFLGWELWGIMTFGIVKILFLLPYKEATMANLYMSLRRRAKDENLPFSRLRCDRYLEEGEGDTYPYDQYFIPEVPGRKLVHVNYRRDYGILSIILLFFTFSMIGWLWEVGLHIFNSGGFVNRGVLHGPWLPIYGSGGVLMLLLLKKFREKPLLTFFLAMVLCGIVEYGTAWYLEYTQHLKWWDYSGYFLNLHGRICLEGLIVFGLGGCAFIYLLAPLLDQIFLKIPKRTAVLVCLILVIIFCADAGYSYFHPNTGKGINEDYSKQTAYEQKVK